MMMAQATAILAGAAEPAEAFGSKRAVGAPPAALAVENLAVAAPAVAAPAALAVAKRR